MICMRTLHVSRSFTLPSPEEAVRFARLVVVGRVARVVGRPSPCTVVVLGSPATLSLLGKISV